MPKVNYVKKARKPNAIVTQADIDRANSGEDPQAAAYYWWKFRFGGRHMSKTRPRASQLTQSAYLSQVYAVQEEIEDAEPADVQALVDWRDGWVATIQEIAEEQRAARDNMPENLQDSETGELLERRADAMETWANELECVDLDDDADVADLLFEIQGCEPEIE